MIPFKPFSYLSILAVAAVTAAPLPVHADNLTVGVVSDLVTLDPQNYRDRITQSILGNIYDGLFLRTDSAHPALISEWNELSPTRIEAVFREGVKFHSGDELTMEDVVFTFERLITEGGIDGTTSPRRSIAGPIESVEISGPNSVILNLSSPYPVLPVTLSTEAILNKSFHDAVGTAGLAQSEDGAGPFKLKEWIPGDRVVLERFDAYYGGPDEPGPRGPSSLDTVTFRVIPDTSARVSALLAGEIDIATEVPPYLQKEISASSNADVVLVNGTRTYFVILNNKVPPFDNVLVRQAANHAVDRQLIIDRVLEGTATLVNGVLSPDAFGASDLPAYDYDPEQAKALLAEAGYPDGLDVVLDVDGALKDVAEVLAAMLTESGIRTKVQVWEKSVLTAAWKEPDNARAMNVGSWGNGSLDPNGIFIPTLKTGDRGNYAGYSNARVDELLSAAQFETNLPLRESMYIEAETIVNQDAPWIFLWVPQDIYGVNPRVKNWSPYPSQMIYLHRAGVE